MAKKKVAAVVKIQIPAGKATPAPPVGTALGPHGVAIMDFCKQYNAATESQAGTIVPVEITIFEDRSFTFILKTPPTPVLLRQAAGLDKGSTDAGQGPSSARSPRPQVEEIAKIKMPDLNAYDLEAAKEQVAGHRPLDGPQGRLSRPPGPLGPSTDRAGTTSPGRSRSTRELPPWRRQEVRRRRQALRPGPAVQRRPRRWTW